MSCENLCENIIPKCARIGYALRCYQGIQACATTKIQDRRAGDKVSKKRDVRNTCEGIHAGPGHEIEQITGIGQALGEVTPYREGMTRLGFFRCGRIGFPNLASKSCRLLQVNQHEILLQNRMILPKSNIKVG